jgi:hypothetical protein
VIARVAAGIVLGVALAQIAWADRDPAVFPAAQCAALWLGQDEYARRSRLLDQDPQDVALAEAFRAVAHRLTNRDAAAIDAFIAGQVPDMVRLVDDYIYGADRQSRDLYESLMKDCADFAATQPETRGLR